MLQRPVGRALSVEDVEEAMLPKNKTNTGNNGTVSLADPKITGEVCLLQDSPYRILRVSTFIILY
jgi:hypothetical protein